MTHALWFAPEVDRIYVMQEGQVIESGTYAELMEQQGAFYDICGAYTSGQEEPVSPTGDVTDGTVNGRQAVP